MRAAKEMWIEEQCEAIEKGMETANVIFDKLGRGTIALSNQINVYIFVERGQFCNLAKVPQIRHQKICTLTFGTE